MESHVIRKITVGKDYKNDAMHYSIGQQVYGGHEISHILFDDKDISYNFEQVETLNKNISNSELIIFKGCSHNLHLEEPEQEEDD